MVKMIMELEKFKVLFQSCQEKYVICDEIIHKYVYIYIYASVFSIINIRTLNIKFKNCYYVPNRAQFSPEFDGMGV